jgi:hypothetical protein
MPAPAKAKEAPIEAHPTKNASNVALTNSMSSTAISLAPNSMTGSKPKKKCFRLRNNHGQRTGAVNARWVPSPERRLARGLDRQC